MRTVSYEALLLIQSLILFFFFWGGGRGESIQLIDPSVSYKIRRYFSQETREHLTEDAQELTSRQLKKKTEKSPKQWCVRLTVPLLAKTGRGLKEVLTLQ
jgi:hypothetical protein